MDKSISEHTPTKVLVADDEAVSRHIMQSTLTKWGYDVVVACDGIEAWEILQPRNAPQLVILDWLMPGMDGISICRKIRETQKLQSTYVIMFTTKGQRNDIIAGLKAGADDYITKPFDREELHARMQAGSRIVELHRIKKQLISIVNHELRTPLTSIVNSLRLITGNEVGQMPEEHATKLVNIAHRNAERLLRMMTNMMDIRKIELGTMHFRLEPQELVPIVKVAVETDREYARQFGVTLRLKSALPDARANVDSERLIQVLTTRLGGLLHKWQTYCRIVLEIYIDGLCANANEGIVICCPSSKCQRQSRMVLPAIEMYSVEMKVSIM